MSFPTSIDRVFVFIFENAELGTVLNNGPFFKQLSQTYGFASNYFAACHPSAPNYLALTCGLTLECGSDATNPFNEKNVADLIETAGLTWVGYMESMPGPCSLPSSGLYVRRHNPFALYTDIANDPVRCKAHVLPLSDFDPTKTPPNFVWVTPNLNNDGHDTSVSFADTWFKGFFTPLLSQPWAATTAFLIVWDEGSTSAGFGGVSGGHIYFCAVSPISKGKVVTSDVTHYNFLTTVEYLLGLGSTGHNDDPTKFPPMVDLFTGGTNHLTVSLSASPSTITLGQSTIITATASGGVAPYTYAWSGLPTPCPGSNTPMISCTPNETGTFTIQVNVTDSASPTPATATATTILTINNPVPTPLAVSLDISPNTIIVGSSVTFTATASGGAPPYTYSWTGLPTPCTGSNTSTIMCNPSQTGTYNIAITVLDSKSSTATANGSLTVNPSPPPVEGLIAVTTPCTSILYHPGESRIVRWAHTSNTGTSVKIELLSNGVLVKTIADNTPNDDVFSWTVPTVPSSGDYQIRVTSLMNSQFTGISGKFFIKPR